MILNITHQELTSDLDKFLRECLIDEVDQAYPVKALVRWMRTHADNGFCILAQVYMEYMESEGGKLAKDVRPYVPKTMFINRPWFANLWAEAAKVYLLEFQKHINAHDKAQTKTTP